MNTKNVIARKHRPGIYRLVNRHNPATYWTAEISMTTNGWLLTDQRDRVIGIYPTLTDAREEASAAFDPQASW